MSLTLLLALACAPTTNVIGGDEGADTANTGRVNLAALKAYVAGNVSEQVVELHGGPGATASRECLSHRLEGREIFREVLDAL